jgi:transcriptional regulator with XRE-family HTH domain
MDKQFFQNYRNLGLNIAFYRKKKNLTQMQLAELLDIDRSHMSAIELATVGVSLDVIFKLCKILEIKPKELFDFRD